MKTFALLGALIAGMTVLGAPASAEAGHRSHRGSSWGHRSYYGHHHHHSHHNHGFRRDYGRRDFGYGHGGHHDHWGHSRRYNGYRNNGIYFGNGRFSFGLNF